MSAQTDADNALLAFQKAISDLLSTNSKQYLVNPQLILNALNALKSLTATTNPVSITSGTALTFLSDRQYGTTSSPETGNITADITGAVNGVSNLIIHNNGSAPTFDTKFKLLSGSGSYVNGQINYIYCRYIDATHILYSINQAS